MTNSTDRYQVIPSLANPKLRFGMISLLFLPAVAAGAYMDMGNGCDPDRHYPADCKSKSA